MRPNLFLFGARSPYHRRTTIAETDAAILSRMQIFLLLLPDWGQALRLSPICQLLDGKLLQPIARGANN